MLFHTRLFTCETQHEYPNIRSAVVTDPTDPTLRIFSYEFSTLDAVLYIAAQQ